MEGRVTLREVDEETLRALLAVAVRDADPGEVMPPVAGPPGWTPRRRAAFLAWHRARRAGPAGPLAEMTFAVTRDGEVVGSARLARRGERGEWETGLWLARSWRGRGVGGAALGAILVEATRVGARVVRADTTARNAAAVAVLRRSGATFSDGRVAGEVHAELPPADAAPGGEATRGGDSGG
ncbi:GNAT family protein [Streptomyces sp. DSM 44915]|uniref:GNAT family protein n=1 Tax=Streptomyces chisholmiae TaxID=3075540 RepID=A0ABU2JNV0_9ACTN|nr:GNAT family protein [Streptomyces sp. DSM 44915]MDT0266654.1 GNAT family protein [Streptomyces sp. DSM 44915]